MSLAVDNLTPTERRLHTVLKDRRLHTREELMACLDDDLAGPSALRFHLSNLRRKLRAQGQGILRVPCACPYVLSDVSS